MPRAPAPDGITIKLRGETYYARGTVRGIGVYQSLGTSCPARAEQLRKSLEDETWARALGVTQAVAVSAPAAGPTFADAVEKYISQYPNGLRPQEARFTEALLRYFGETPLTDIRQARFLKAMSEVVPAHRTQAYKARAVGGPLRAILRYAALHDLCGMPVLKMPQVPKSTSGGYFRPDQGLSLISHAAEHLKPLLGFMFATGCRLSEAIDLEWNDVDLKGKQATLTVKGDRHHGEEYRRKRTVNLVPAAFEALLEIDAEMVDGRRIGFVFRPHKSGVLTGDRYRDTDRTSGGQIKGGWRGANQRAGLPGHIRTWTDKDGVERSIFVPQETPHATRRSWATWHYCVYRDLLKLQREGDWSDQRMVEHYANHGMPSVYKDEVIAFWGLTGSALRDVA